jgi:hypothetical protein
MRLISEQDFMTLQSIKSSNVSPNSSTEQITDYKSSLTSQALSTLMNDNLPSDLKLRVYNELNKRMKTEDKRNNSKPILVQFPDVEDVSKVTPPAVLTDPESKFDSIPLPPGMTKIPPKFEAKFHSIMRIIDANKDKLSWDREGQLIRNGIVIKHSNVTDLLNTVIRGLKPHAPLTGHSEFMQALSDMNVPKTLLSKQAQMNISLKTQRRQSRLSNSRAEPPPISQLYGEEPIQDEEDSSSAHSTEHTANQSRWKSWIYL